MERAEDDLETKGIFHVRGGIDRYLKTFPEGGYWKGRNYLFDLRGEQCAQEKDGRGMTPLHMGRAHTAPAESLTAEIGASVNHAAYVDINCDLYVSTSNVFNWLAKHRLLRRGSGTRRWFGRAGSECSPFRDQSMAPMALYDWPPWIACRKASTLP